jgi:hypothetical protein
MMPPLSRSPQANDYNASMMPPLSRSPQANGSNASMMPPSARCGSVPTYAIEKREQRKYRAAFRSMARTSAERTRVSAEKAAS